MEIILASASQTRQGLIKELGVPYLLCPAEVEETMDFSLSPEAFTLHNAELKADWVLNRHPGGLVLAADTILYSKGRYYLKPTSHAEAVEMLMSLSGVVFPIYTGICLRNHSREVDVLHCEATQVHMKTYGKKEVEAYFRNHDAMRASGGLVIERADELIDHFEGSLSSAKGLPLEFLIHQLSKLEHLQK